MNVKRFVAADMRRALDLVKQELGPDAVILSTNRTKAGVEIITSVAGADDWRQLDTKVLPNSSVHLSYKNSGKNGATKYSSAQAREQIADDGETPMQSDGAWAGQSAIGYLMEKQRQREAPPPFNCDPASAHYDRDALMSMARLPHSEPRPQNYRSRPAAEFVGQPVYDNGIRYQKPPNNPQPPNTSQSSNNYAPYPADDWPSTDATPVPAPAIREDAAGNVAGNSNDTAETSASTLWDLLKLENCSFVFTPPTPAFAAGDTETRQVEQEIAAAEEAPVPVEPAIALQSQDTTSQDVQAPACIPPDPFDGGGIDSDIDSEREWSEIGALKSEIADMRELLQTQLERLASSVKPQPRVQIVSSVKAAINRRLRHLGLPQNERDKLLTRISDTVSLADGWTEVLAILAHQLPIQGLDIVDKGGFFAFVGPSGSGKTTTLSKLAARYVLKHGPRNVAIVTIDSQGIAARQQLQRLGKILGIPVHVVRDCKHLVYQLDDLCQCSLVLIDTPSRRHGDPQLKEQLRILRNLPQVQSLLVTAANTQAQMLKASIHAYKPAGLVAGILTKLDDTVSLGEVLAVVMQENLPVAYATNGPDITRDITVSRAHQLVARAVALLKDESQRQKQLQAGAGKQPIKRGFNRATLKKTALTGNC